MLPRVLMELLAQMEARSMAKEAGDFLDTLPRPDGWTGSWTSGVLAAGRPQERVVSLDGQPGPGKRAGAERHHTAAWPPPRPPRCAARLARDARPCVNWNRSFKISIFLVRVLGLVSGMNLFAVLTLLALGLIGDFRPSLDHNS